MGNLRGIERYMVIAMCGLQLKDRNRVIDLMLMVGFNEAVNQLTIVDIVLV